MGYNKMNQSHGLSYDDKGAFAGVSRARPLGLLWAACVVGWTCLSTGACWASVAIFWCGLSRMAVLWIGVVAVCGLRAC